MHYIQRKVRLQDVKNFDFAEILGDGEEITGKDIWSRCCDESWKESSEIQNTNIRHLRNSHKLLDQHSEKGLHDSVVD